MMNTTPLQMKQVLRVLKNDAKSKVAKLRVNSYSDLQFCYDTLNEVSRSFALVIQDLPVDLKDAICVFYLILRALDTIEDDMSLDQEEKLRILKDFHLKCGDESFYLNNVGDKEAYVKLLQSYPRVNRVYNGLSTDYQQIIRNVTYEMSRGMQFFIEKDVDTKKDYDLYCHYVAGLVGQGLSDIFLASSLESNDLLRNKKVSNSMGLFLQKTNITRDFYEDIEEGRIFWPKEIWSVYTEDLKALKINSPKSIACLNKMVENAFDHLGDCIRYLEALENDKVFRFCAIPQLMAIGTLSLIYNQHNALLENVKMDKQETMKIFSSVNNMQDFLENALVFLNRIKLQESDVAFAVQVNALKKELHKKLA